MPNRTYDIGLEAPTIFLFHRLDKLSFGRIDVGRQVTHDLHRHLSRVCSLSVLFGGLTQTDGPISSSGATRGWY